LAQTLSAIAIITWLVSNPQYSISTDLLFPFFKDLVLPLGAIGLAIFSYFVIVGSSNAVNLTACDNCNCTQGLCQIFLFSTESVRRFFGDF
jgi:UDP-N-acetylmuramyl pentapeptide phosphotransferase/UDP-N-acetylglucosamine-1-phosphate transferase